MKQATEKSRSPSEVVFDYHEQTKHTLQRYAKGPETIDWSDQPDAFRRYEGASTIELPFVLDKLSITYDELFQKIAPNELNLVSLSGLLELSFGLSAWKQYGPDRWALRCNPSSGNLHPTEAYLLLYNLVDVEDGIYHYRPDQHQLEKRCEINLSSSTDDPVALICLSSIHWREAWKYGERAFRYSQLDTGHAMATTRYAAACYGWQVKPRLDAGNHLLDKIFGFDRSNEYIDKEHESSEILLSLQTSESVSDITLEQISTSNWSGKANLLDKHHFYDWPVINDVDNATESPGETKNRVTKYHLRQNTNSDYPAPLKTSNELATTIIKQRRSAQFFDGETVLPETSFWNMIDKLLPRSDNVPFDLLAWQPRVHPVIFLHRVENLECGLYVLPRHKQAKLLLKSEFRQDLKWEHITGPKEHLYLYKLVQANCENAAKTLFCHQDIASQSAFSIAILAEFEDHLAVTPWRYRQLFWEAGILGQALYLEAEAYNFRATGVGCYFDDNFHELLGLKTSILQSLYHFTVGMPVVDNRITSLSGYYHINRKS